LQKGVTNHVRALACASSFGGEEDLGDIGVDRIEGPFVIVLSAFPSLCKSVEKDLGSVLDIVGFKHLQGHFKVLLRCLDIRPP
jgi:hypothetical protein